MSVTASVVPPVVTTCFGKPLVEAAEAGREVREET